MDSETTSGADLAVLDDELRDLVEETFARAAEDPFGNPLLSLALAITRRIDRGRLDLADLTALVRRLRDQAFADRAARLAHYLGGIDSAANDAALALIAERLIRPDPEDSPVPLARLRSTVERTRFTAVFTAHPTFALPPDVFAALAEAASGGEAGHFPSHRPGAVTLLDEFAQANAAIGRGRDALDRFNAALLAAARACWRDRWTKLMPRPITLASWVGYDTDGRTDVDWYHTLGLRLRMKQLQLERLAAQLAALPGTEALSARVAEAVGAVAAQVAACPATPDADGIAAFAHVLIERREAAMTTAEPLAGLFEAAIEAAEEHDKLALCVARAGLMAHGLSLAHTQTRLNGTQLHNAVRQRLGFADDPEDPARRRGLLAAINAALDTVEALPIDFGALLAEKASAMRLMMTVAQIVKHVDGSTPVRFLIAETETGYTLLAALWLARLCSIADQVEISPLFETAEALERGAHVLEEALRSPHWREYLKRTGKLSLQFGYSDSGRYVGQLAASFLIERLRLRIADTLARHGVTGVEVILFDTHGESIGRGAHPGSLAERLKYLSPTASRQALARAGLSVREESAFQGGDGYALFGTPALALATVARIAEHAYPASNAPSDDPIYADADFAADFFTSIGLGMRELVEDPGYAALLGAFGPALIDKTGSRPAARQADGVAGPSTIRHPRELRAIPNNAILQQLGWCANTLQGLGHAIGRQPESFAERLADSPRFRRAMDLAAHALAHSDIDVLRALVATLDPTTWLDRAAHARFPSTRGKELVAIARGVERLGLAAPVQAMFRRIQADHVALRSGWPQAPQMATRERLLHALRLALINRIWLLQTAIPDFSPRYGVTRVALEARILRLDIGGAVDLLADIFPAAADPAAERDFGEPKPPRGATAYAREHDEIFTPMRALFALVREIGTAITHEVGAFG